VQYYDFSESAQEFLGNDIAWNTTIHNMDKLFSTVNQSELGQQIKRYALHVFQQIIALAKLTCPPACDKLSQQLIVLYSSREAEGPTL